MVEKSQEEINGLVLFLGVAFVFLFNTGTAPTYLTHSSGTLKLLVYGNIMMIIGIIYIALTALYVLKVQVNHLCSIQLD